MRRLILALTCLGIVTSLLPAQSIQTADLSSAELRGLPLPLGADGASAENILAEYGVKFGGNGASAQLAARAPDVQQPEPVALSPVVKNIAPTGQDLPLVIDFDRSVSKIRFQFVKGGAGNHASVNGYDREGTLLGTLDIQIANDPLVGITASNPRGISKLVIKYLGANKNEEVTDLAVEFVTPPVFTTVLPQVATGPLGGGLSLATAITILNVSNTRATGEIRFYNDIGYHTKFPFVGKTVTIDTFALDLDPYEMFAVRTRSDLSTISGYAIITSTGPLQASASFRTMEGSAVESDTSLASVPPRYTIKGTFERSEPSGTVGGGLTGPIIDSALGIVNLSDEDATVIVSCVDNDGLYQAVEIPLEAGHHYARFIQEILPELQGNSTGVFQIVSASPIAATLVRTSNGLPITILPLASMEEGD